MGGGGSLWEVEKWTPGPGQAGEEEENGQMVSSPAERKEGRTARPPALASGRSWRLWRLQFWFLSKGQKPGGCGLRSEWEVLSRAQL